MNNKVLLFIILMSLWQLSCQREFPIGESTGSELCLICFPGQNDTTVVQLYMTVPIGGRYEGSPYLSEASLTFSVNGADKPIEQVYERSGSIPYGCWYIDGCISPNDIIEINANHRGASTIKATTTIPPLPPIFGFNCIKSSDTSLCVFFEDDPSSVDYYGIALLCEKTSVHGNVSTTEVKHLNLLAEGYGSHESTINKNYYDIGFSGWFLGVHNVDCYGVRVWSDKLINGGDIVLSARFGPGYFDEETDGTEDRRRYKVLLYRLSEEFYKYVASLSYQSFNDYASYGIVPMMPSYTNVAGGCGILAGWSVRESEWFVISE